MVIGSAVQIIVVGKFFHAFFNISYGTGAILGTLIVLIYSLFGGFKGVVLTEGDMEKSKSFIAKANILNK